MLRADFESQLPTHLPALRSLAKRMVGNPDDADDLVQDALLRASNALGSFREDSSLKTWLFSITTRTAIDHLRATKRWNPQAMIDACDARGAASVREKFGDPSVVFDVEQHVAFCFTCIGRSLEPEQQAALVLKEVFGLGNDEAAQTLGLTEPQFRHALSAARDAMRTRYEGLCALVNKNGACYQCRVLREMAPTAQQGKPQPAFPLPFDERMKVVRASPPDSKLSDYFFHYTRQLQRG